MKKLDLEEVKATIKRIKELEGDDENQHSEEDNLYSVFVEQLAKGLYTSVSEIQKTAKEIQKTKNIIFSRWCA